MAEAAITAITVAKFSDNLKRHLFYRYKNHLCDSFAGFDLIGRRAAIPARDKDLALIIRVNKSGKVAEHESVFVPQTRPRQQNSS